MLNVNGSANAPGAIFSTAFNAIRAAGGNFPQCWQNLVGSS